MPIVLHISKEEIINYVKENADEMNATEMAANLSIGLSTILRVINKLKTQGLHFKQTSAKEQARLRAEYIKRNPHIPSSQLARQLGLCEKYIQNLRKRLSQPEGFVSTRQREANAYIEHHPNNIFNVNARWSWLAG